MIGQRFGRTGISLHCKELNMEICAIQLETKTSNLITLSMYTALSPDFHQFLWGSELL
jgi:hypothetical protein